MPDSIRSETFLRLSHVKAKTGLGRTTILEQVKARLLPPPAKLAVRAVAWPQSELDAVLAARLAGADDDAVRKLVAALVSKREGTPR